MWTRMPLGPKSFYVWYGQDDMAIRNLEANEVSHFEDCGHDNRESTTWPYSRHLVQLTGHGFGLGPMGIQVSGLPVLRPLRSGPRFTPRAAVSQDQPTAHVAQESTWPAGPQVT
jgi:hypothetical protein